MRDATMCVRIYTGFEDEEISLRYTNGSEQRAVIIIRHRFMAMDNKSCAAVARKYRYLAMVKSACSPEEGAVSLSFSQYNVTCVTFLPGAAVSLSVKGEELMEQKAKRSPVGNLPCGSFMPFVVTFCGQWRATGGSLAKLKVSRCDN
ncbi:hypothetical protein [Raoultella ornithinolytica]|uniref:hypothetical protein n=1 Tax=Raoultella ornithinolytica TaxID=54291 RepID=UPI001C93180E